MTRRTCAVASTLAMMLVCLATPAIGAGAHWGQVVVPGGVQAARRVLKLGDSKGRFDASLVVDFTYRHSRTGDWSRATDRLRRYLANVDTIHQIIGDGMRVAPPPASAPRADAGRFRSLREALGIERRKVDGQVRYVAGQSATDRERAEWAGALGLDIEGIAVAWTMGEAEALSLTTGFVPLPLPEFWSESAPAVAIDLGTVLRDRETGLFYTGLMALDEQTLAWFDAHRRVLQRIREQSAPAFSAFARSVQIDNSVVVTPGGSGMTMAWARLGGRAVSEPGGFLAALLTVDDGLLMYFVDAVRHASPSVQQALSARVTQQVAAIDEMYRAFREAAGAWSINARPFDRPSQDPAWTLSLLQLPGGHIGGPAWLPAVLERVTRDANWPEKPRPLSARLPVGDVAWTMQWLFERPGEQLERVKLLRFTQRLERLDASSPDAVEVALRTFLDLPALALALERMGTRDADTIGRMGRAGYALSRAADRTTIEPILARWQASLALVEQAARLRHLAPRVTSPLVLSLADAAVRPPRETTDRILHWMTDTLLPALAPLPDATNLGRESITRVLAMDSATRAKVIWEGLGYERNPLRVARRDVDALALSAGAPLRADQTALDRLHRRLDEGLRSPEEARNMATDFDAMRTVPGRPSLLGPQPDDRFNRQLGIAARALRTDPPIARSGAAPTPDLDVSNVFGAAADQIVQPVVYALAMTPLHQTPSLQADAWAFHDLSPAEARDDWWRQAWQPATQEARRGGGSGLMGSWLLLDLSLGEAMVPRRFDRADSLATPVLDAIFRDLALRVQPSDADIEMMADAVRRLARGRSIVADWQRAAANGDAGARLDPRGRAMGATRRGVLAWSLERDVDAIANMSLSEIASLGGPAHVASMALDGCACIAAAPAWAIDDTRPYWMAGVPAAFATDLQLRIAELLTGAHLPLQLVADILPLAAADWLSHVEPYSNDDWESLTTWPRQLTLAEIEGYVMQLVAEGVLAPLDEAVP
ncbi:MAG: hypothetical protein ABI634_18930 [Acidobacteriota bacterium]